MERMVGEREREREGEDGGESVDEVENSRGNGMVCGLSVETTLDGVNR